jgi:hypothetical protein
MNDAATLARVSAACGVLESPLSSIKQLAVL